MLILLKITLVIPRLMVLMLMSMMLMSMMLMLMMLTILARAIEVASVIELSEASGRVAAGLFMTEG